jgi:hypothetical protein
MLLRRFVEAIVASTVEDLTRHLGAWLR